jgi:hypothetical protein
MNQPRDCARSLTIREPDRDPSVVERGRDARRSDLERTAQAGDDDGQHAHVLRPLGTPIAGLKLVLQDPGQNGRVLLRGPDRLVSGMVRGPVAHRTDVLIHQTGPALGPLDTDFRIILRRALAQTTNLR